MHAVLQEQMGSWVSPVLPVFAFVARRACTTEHDAPGAQTVSAHAAFRASCACATTSARTRRPPRTSSATCSAHRRARWSPRRRLSRRAPRRRQVAWQRRGQAARLGRIPAMRAVTMLARTLSDDALDRGSCCDGGVDRSCRHRECECVRLCIWLDESRP